jgi:ubiquinone/menaquinone biosynthesis C-methylase UbiE
MFTDREKVLEQYKNSNNLSARIALHQKFSTGKTDIHVWIFDQMQIERNARFLELGTGSAKFWRVNRERLPKGWTITLSDISEGMLGDAKKNVEDVPGAFSFQVVDAQAIPFEDSSFDLVMANAMLYHVPDVDKSISEIRRVLKPDGRFYAGTGGLTHMKELDEFVEEHMAPKLPGVFTGLGDITKQFALENGEEMLSKHFENVELHLPPKRYLHVTEAEPFIAYILSMARWSELIEGVSKQQVDEIVAEAREIAEKNLPIRITTSTGLFEAW